MSIWDKIYKAFGVSGSNTAQEPAQELSSPTQSPPTPTSKGTKTNQQATNTTANQQHPVNPNIRNQRKNQRPPNQNMAKVNSHPTSNHSSNKPSNSGWLTQFGAAGSVLKWIGYILAFIVLIMTLIFVATITSVDLAVMKLNLSGQIVDNQGNGIANASIAVGGRETTSNDSGLYLINNLDPGTYTLEVGAEGYETITKEIDLDRSFLNYDNNHSVILNAAGEGYIVGQFITSDTNNYSFIDDTLTVNGDRYQVLSDGTFRAPDLTTGNAVLNFASANYVDINRNIDLDSGENLLEPIELIPSGDIVGSLKSYVREDIVPNLDIVAEGIPRDQIEISEESGIFRIRDLEIGQEYRIQISHPNYVNKEYMQEVEQGETTLFGLRIVEDGRVVYLREDPEDLEIFASNYDGSEEAQLTDDDIEPYGEFLDTEDELVYFLSTRDNVRSTLGGEVLAPYVVPLEEGNAQRLLSNEDDLGKVSVNFKAGRMMHVTSLNDDNTDRIVQVMNLTGNNRRTIFETTAGEIIDLKLADNGDGAFSLISGQPQFDGLYITDISEVEATRVLNKQPVQIFDISSDGDKILYSAANENTDLLDLFVYTISTGQDRKLRNAFNGNQYQFVGDSVNDIIFFDSRDESSNLFSLNIQSNQERQLTNFSELEGVEAVYQQGDFVLYQTNRGLYIMDFTKPHPEKLVTNNVNRYTGYDF